jgi:outer membrane receptor protein involved in Fe transport
VNAGETLHRGIEVGAAAALPWDLRLDVGFSRADHTYDEWSPQAGTDFSGNLMEQAPSRTANAALTWTPQHRPGMSAGIETQHVGPYWMDAANTARYDGHTTVALRAEVPLTGNVTVFGRVTNLFDERYAELAQYTAARGRELAPGLPRALYIGARGR